MQYLTDENIEEIGAALTHVERMRLQAALQALRGTYQPSSLVLCVALLFVTSQVKSWPAQCASLFAKGDEAAAGTG